MSAMLDPRRVKFSPVMQGAREFVGEQVRMAVAAALAQNDAEWVASLPKCKQGGDECASPATVLVLLQDAIFCDEHATGIGSGEALPYADRVRALTAKMAP